MHCRKGRTESGSYNYCWGAGQNTKLQMKYNLQMPDLEIENTDIM